MCRCLYPSRCFVFPAVPNSGRVAGKPSVTVWLIGTGQRWVPEPTASPPPALSVSMLADGAPETARAGASHSAVCQCKSLTVNDKMVVAREGTEPRRRSFSTASNSSGKHFTEPQHPLALPRRDGYSVAVEYHRCVSFTEAGANLSMAAIRLKQNEQQAILESKIL